VLRALGLAGDRDAGGEMGDAHGRIGGVDVLAARTRGTVGVDAHVGFADVDLDRIVDDRIDPDARERGVAPRVGIEGRDAHQAVHARFRLQPAIGVVTLDEQGRRLDAGLLALVDFQHLDLEAAPLGPARVHAQEHVGPVLALGAAGTRMDFEIGVVAVGLARQHGFDLARPGLAGQRADRRLGLGDDGRVALLLAELDQAEIVLERLGEAAHRPDAVVERLALAHQLLGFLRVIPETGILRAHVQVV